MKKTAKLRELLKREEMLVLPGGGTPLAGIIAEQLGFECMYMSGYGTAAFQLGVPDIGLMTLTEALSNAKHMAQATNNPLIADIDTGYGNAINVKHTVREFERAGVAGVQMEDQDWPKKCGHMENKKLISSEEMAGKIRAAADAREDKDVVIIARTDANTVFGFDEAVRRSNLYAEAGADVIFFESPLSMEEIERIPQVVHAPVMINMSEGAKTPIVNNRRLAELGYKIALWPSSTTWAIAAAIRDILQELKTKGTTEYCQDRLVTFREFNGIIGLERYLQDGKQYE